MAKDGGVFSDMKTSFEPAYCFHFASSDDWAWTRERVMVEPSPRVSEPTPRAVAAPPPSSRNLRRLMRL